MFMHKIVVKLNNKNEVRGFSLVQVPFVTLSRSPEQSEGASEGSKRTRRFFPEPVLSDMRFFASLRMTRSEGLRMTKQESNNG
jgi:hypothetical protein